MYIYEILDEFVSECDAYGMHVYVMLGVCVSVWDERRMWECVWDEYVEQRGCSGFR